MASVTIMRYVDDDDNYDNHASIHIVAAINDGQGVLLSSRLLIMRAAVEKIAIDV